MPCRDAMTVDVITASPEQTVADAMNLFHKHNIRSVPIVDENNVVIGVFSFSHLLRELLPASVTLDDETMHGHHMSINLDHIPEGASWVAKRLKLYLPEKLEEIMIKAPKTVRPETRLSEGIRLLVKYGSPLPVVKDNDNELVGVISSQNILKSLQEITTQINNGDEVDE